MTDTFSKKQRSEIMKAVKSKGNKSTEIKLMELFKLRRITGWRRNYKLLGRPDFVFPKQRVALFADGCFWHGHHCRNVHPSDNAEYWRSKINRNKARDKAISKELREKGWKVVRIWECEIKKGEMRKLMAAGLFPSPNLRPNPKP
ncbi:MAG: very short patch repair endonuclease [Chloroflexi bacterium]|nr:very short patch repair endonuclease [Chloroflexota bacterium]